MTTAQIITHLQQKQLQPDEKQQIMNILRQDELVAEANLPEKVQIALMRLCELQQIPFGQLKLSDLCRRITEKQILRIPKFGKTSLAHLRHYLQDRGFVMKKK